MSQSDQHQQRRPRVRTGFMPAPCIHCGQPGNMSLDLQNLCRVNCDNCHSSVSLGEIQEAVDSWLDLLDWVNRARRMDDTNTDGLTTLE